MNPNAKPFSFSASASTWTPSFGAPAAAEDAPAPPAAAEAAVVPPPAPVVEEVAAESAADEDEDAIDENDPLWLVTLKVAEGDREKALRMLEDPDTLMQYPEIRKVMESTEAEDDDWETNDVTDAIADCAISSSSTDVVEDTTLAVGSTSSLPSTSNVKEPEVKASELKAASSSSITPSSSSQALTAGEDVQEAEAVDNDGDPRENLNLVFIGHVDAGKSTLSGSILYLMGMVDARTIERFEKEAKQRNRESWFLAFIMDTSEEERAKGITVEVGRANFESETYRYTILDAPGHKNYVPNMISGAAQADIGVLVISARKGEFETGFEKGGQTREHALLAKTLGVQYLIVVINKMDDPTVEWDIKRYEECVSKLKPYLKSCGYTIKTEVKFVPISGLMGHNVLNEVPEATCGWWKNMYKSGLNNTTTSTLLSTFDSLVITGRNAEASLRMPCVDRYFERGCCVLGKIASGTIRVGDEILIAPTKKKARVDAVYVGETKLRSARAGENVMVKLNVNVEDIQKGFILCSPTSFCPAVVEMKVQLALVDMLDHRPLFTPGYEAVMHLHSAEIEVVCQELVYVMDETGQKRRRPFARQGQVCVCKFKTPLSTCMEKYEDFAALGRVTLRDEGRTIAIGKIVELVK